jgi:hypothetical protein
VYLNDPTVCIQNMQLIYKETFTIKAHGMHEVPCCCRATLLQCAAQQVSVWKENSSQKIPPRRFLTLRAASSPGDPPR